MEPEQTSTEKPLSKFENLHKVTPLSRYLAMALFIVLPFVGGWVGYNLALEKNVVETETIEIEKIASSDYLTAAPAIGLDPLKVKFQTSYTYPDTYAGGKSLFIHFGDGHNTLVKGNVHHTYSTSGVYEVKLMGCNLNNDFLCEEIEVDSLKIEVTPEKVVEVERIVEVKPEKNRVNVTEKIEHHSTQSFNTTYGGSRFGEIGVSSDGTKRYLVQLPYNESVCCEYLHYIQKTNPDNGFTTIEEFFSVEEAGLLYQHKWPVSQVTNHIVVSTFNDNALLLCDQGMGLDNKRVNNVLNIIDMDTAEVKTIFTHEYVAADITVNEFSSNGSEVIVEQTMYPVDETRNCANNLLPGDTKTVSYPVELPS